MIFLSDITYGTSIIFHCINVQNVFISFLLEGISVSSVAQPCPTLCDPVDCSTPGFPVHCQLPELAQTHVPRVRDTIQSSYPVSPVCSFCCASEQKLL